MSRSILTWLPSPFGTLLVHDACFYPAPSHLPHATTARRSRLLSSFDQPYLCHRHQATSSLSCTATSLLSPAARAHRSLLCNHLRATWCLSPTVLQRLHLASEIVIVASSSSSTLYMAQASRWYVPRTAPYFRGSYSEVVSRETTLYLTRSYFLVHILLLYECAIHRPSANMVLCSQLTQDCSALTNACTTGFPPTTSLSSRTWDVLNLIQDAEEADGAA